MEDNADTCTLRVLHLPPTLTDEGREELFKHYGATKTRTIRKSDKYTITFVEFSSKSHARNVLVRLHQLLVNGKRLSIEYAKQNVSAAVDKENKIEISNDNEKEEQLSKSKAQYKEFLKKLNSWAPYDVVSQPVPPNLKYKYPPPSKGILMRIAIQLIKEKAFYTQVLHLMNKMNLPPPFEELEGDFPIVKELYDIENYQDLFGITVASQNLEVSDEHQEEAMQIEEESEEESELESDEDSSTKPLHIIPEKRRKLPSKKRLKIPKFINSLKQPSVLSSRKKQKIQDVFDVPKVDSRNQKITLKPLDHNKIHESSSIVADDLKPTAESTGNAEGFGIILPPKKDESNQGKDKEGEQEFITTDQLHNNKVSEHDSRATVFKNYHPGNPTNRLYIKNLAKTVEENDLHFIYRRYVLPSSKSTESEYNVRLMQEGRMKGQAFVTLPNIAQAQLALEETNRYLLKEKPMVVQFAKASK